MKIPSSSKPSLPQAFPQFSGQFYDGISEFNDTPEDAIRFAMQGLSPSEREELAAFIRLTLENGMTDRELELVWLRGRGDMYPGRHMVRGFHETILRVLDTHQGQPPP